jgi:peptidyl-prolyl cis-trans isomerase B (cyclophilin B)
MRQDAGTPNRAEDEKMAVCATWGRQAIRSCGAWVFLAVLLCGCSREDDSARKGPETPASADPVPTPVDQASAEQMNQPFAEATISDMPDQYLPDLTLSGKSVGKLYESVARRWDTIRYTDAKGKPITYIASLDTELGTIEIELLPNLAPNHVRNFIALAQCGYYDGLVFERTISDQSENDPSTRIEFIEGGCPAGTGDPGYGSIGYWLKPEFSKDVAHLEGTVGACRGERPDSAGCRFYITLSKCPVMDGERTIFGKVAKTLDVVRRISTQPVINSPEFPLGDRPEKPIVIRKVTILTGPETSGPNGSPVQQVQNEDPKAKKSRSQVANIGGQ